MGILKNKNSRNFNDPTRIAISTQLSKEGKTKHNRMLDEMDRKRGEELEHRLAKYKKGLETEGWNEKEIELLTEAWSIRAVKDKSTYREDKKTIKRLIKEANELKAKRSK
jgi:hypothetical protein